MTIIQARVALQQRVLPEYRAPFFELLGASCLQGLSVFAGLPREDEAIASAKGLKTAGLVNAENIHISRGKTYFCYQKDITDWLSQWQPSVLIVEANPRYLSTPSAVQWMHSRRRPVIGWGLGAPKNGGLEAAFRNNFLKNLDAMISYSKAGAEQYIQAGCAREKVFVAPNAVESRPVQSAPFRPLEFQNGKANLLFVGRLQQRKKLDTLLTACAGLPGNLQPNLTIVGDGPDRARLEEAARQIYPTTQFAGAKFGAELAAFYNRADLFVLPGTGGLAVQQAMAHALPVIVGEADGTQAELVRDKNGWILSNASAEALTLLLQTALQDVKQLRAMGAESYRIVSTEVNLEAMVEAFAKAIKSVL